MPEPDADCRPKKHSLTLSGHRTSVSLEDAFWDEFCRIARREGRAINDLAAEIDAARGTRCTLASAIRLHVLERLRAQAPGQSPAPPDREHSRT